MTNAFEQEIAAICADVARITGVQLGDKQRRMVLSRLMRRAIHLGLGDLEHYVEHFRRHRAEETEALVSLLTTHHTAFFREAAHFQFLEASGLAAVAAAAKARGAKKIRVLSAACSRGQECYTLSMLLAHQLPKVAPDLAYEIVGTDVDSESIAIAKNGVYHRDEIKVVPAPYLARHWTRGTGTIADFVKANESIRKPCTFHTDNLLAPALAEGEKFDIIFCRNVFIYFTPEQIKQIAASLLKRLYPSGFLFVGLSESLYNAGLNVKSLGPSIYQPAAAPARAEAAKPQAASSLIKVLCVDDSPVVLKILAKILDEEHGFKIVATAGNGIEAGDAVAAHAVDVMTLDIHMPKETGLAYLQRNFSPKHPPVVVFSSVSRDDKDLAGNCLRAGASDYVEKPSLRDLDERAEEIRTKVRCAAQAGVPAVAQVNAIDAAFAATVAIADPSSKLRIIVMSPSDRDKVAGALGEIAGVQPATVIFVDGGPQTLAAIAQDLSARSGRPIETWTGGPATLRDDRLYVGAMSQLDGVLAACGARTASILIYSDVATASVSKLLAFKRRNILAAEDSAQPAGDELRELVDDVVPTTSFINMSNHFLARRGA